MNADLHQLPGGDSALKKRALGALMLLGTALLGGGFALLAHFAGAGWAVAILMLGSGLLSFILWRQNRRFREHLENLTVEEAGDYKRLCEEFGVDKPFGELEEAELNWAGKILDIVLGSLSFVLPVLISLLARGQQIGLDTALSGRDVVSALFGCVVYLLIRKKLLNRFIVVRTLRFASREDA